MATRRHSQRKGHREGAEAISHSGEVVDRASEIGLLGTGHWEPSEDTAILVLCLPLYQQQSLCKGPGVALPWQHNKSTPLPGLQGTHPSPGFTRLLSATLQRGDPATFSSSLCLCCPQGSSILHLEPYDSCKNPISKQG